MNESKPIEAETQSGSSLQRMVRRWEQLGKCGVTVSICFGKCGDMGMLYSVDALGPDGQTFDKPFGAETLGQAMHIAEKESFERGWVASNDQAHLSAPGGRVERNQKEQ